MKISNHADATMSTQLGCAPDHSTMLIQRAHASGNTRYFVVDNDINSGTLDPETLTGNESGVTLYAEVLPDGTMNYFVPPTVLGRPLEYVEKSTSTLRNDNTPLFGGSDVMTEDPDGLSGWHYTNDGGKINIYPFGHGESPLKTYTTRDLFSLISLVQVKTTSSRLPYFVVYTKPEGDGNDFSWYRSRLNFEFVGGTWVAGQSVTLVAGADNPEFFANTQRVTAGYIDFDAGFAGSSKGPLAEALTADVSGDDEFTLMRGLTVPSEEILYISLQTDSSEAAGGYDFTLSHSLFDLGSAYEYHYEAVPVATVLPDTGHQKIVYSAKPQLVGFTDNQVREFDLTSGVAALDARSNPTAGNLYDSADDRTYCVDIVNGLIVPNQVDKQAHRVVVSASYIQKGGTTNSDMGAIGRLVEYDGTAEQAISEKIIMMPFGDERDGVLEFTFDVVSTSAYTVGSGKGFKFKLEMLEGDGNITFDLESIQVVAM